MGLDSGFHFVVSEWLRKKGGKKEGRAELESEKDEIWLSRKEGERKESSISSLATPLVTHQVPCLRT